MESIPAEASVDSCRAVVSQVRPVLPASPVSGTATKLLSKRFVLQFIGKNTLACCVWISEEVAALDRGFQCISEAHSELQSVPSRSAVKCAASGQELTNTTLMAAGQPVGERTGAWLQNCCR